MIIERSGNEILVRISANLDLRDIQDILDYLAYKEAAFGTKASPEDAAELSRSAKRNIWTQVKNKRGLK